LAICLDRLLGHLGRVEIAQWLRTNRSDLNKMMLSKKDFRSAQARWVAVKRCAMKNGILTVLAGAVMAVLATTVSAAEPTQVERVQAAIDAWLAARAPIEKVTGMQQQEWTELVSTKTGEPIATVSADNPEGFALGLAERILGPLGAQRFYEGESLGYRTIYVWIADQDLMITVQTNSHPPEVTAELTGGCTDVLTAGATTVLPPTMGGGTIIEVAQRPLRRRRQRAATPPPYRQ
jgi:hypothetical protein